MPVQQPSNSSPEVDTTWDDAKSAFDEVTQGPAAEPELPLATPDDPSTRAQDKTETTTETKPEAETKADDRPRDEQGRFVEKDKAAEKSEVKPQQAAPQEPPKSPSAPPAAAKVEATAAPPVGGPPTGMSVQTKANWEKLPDYVRADIIRREQETEKGFAQYEDMRGLRVYVDMAKNSGTTLKAALDNYTGIERLINQDIFRGLTQIAANKGLTPQQLVAGLQTYHGVGQSNGHAQVPQEGQSYDPPPEVLQQYITPLRQEVSQNRQLLEQFVQEKEAQEQSALTSTFERFRADPAHRYFENVRPLMAQFIRGEVIRANPSDYYAALQTAYDKACWWDDEVRAQLIKEQSAKADADRKAQEKAAADKARQASRSITGSPSSTVTENRNRSGDSIEDDARDAYRSVMATSRV